MPSRAPVGRLGALKALRGGHLGGFSKLQLGVQSEFSTSTSALRYYLFKGSILTVSSPHYKKNQLHRGGLGEAHLDMTDTLNQQATLAMSRQYT